MSTDIEQTQPLGEPHPSRRRPPPQAKLTCVNPALLDRRGRREIPLEGSEITLGRSEKNSVVLDLDGISRTHARVVPGDGSWGIQDLGSKNGIRVNKTPVAEAWLDPGDVISIGNIHYKYTLEERGSVETSAHQIDLRGIDATMLVTSIDGDEIRSRFPAARLQRRRTSPRYRTGVGRKGRDRVRRSERESHGRRSLRWWGAVLCALVLAAILLS